MQWLDKQVSHSAMSGKTGLSHCNDWINRSHSWGSKILLENLLEVFWKLFLAQLLLLFVFLLLCSTFHVINPIQDELFWGLLADRGAKRFPLYEVCHTYLTLMKLDTVIPYLKKIPKIDKSRDAPLGFCWHQHFFTRNQEFLLYQEIQV